METMQAKFCYRCGRQLLEEDRFCQQCGADVEPMTDEPQFYGTQEEDGGDVPNFIPPSVIDEAETVIARQKQTPLPARVSPIPVKETVIVQRTPVVIEKPSQTNKVLVAALGIVSLFALGLGFLLYTNLSRPNTAATNNVNVKIAAPTRTPNLSNGNVNVVSPSANVNLSVTPSQTTTNAVVPPDVINSPTLAPTPPDVLPETPTPLPTPDAPTFRFGTRYFEGKIGANYEVSIELIREGNVLNGHISPKNGGKNVAIQGFIQDNGEFTVRETDSVGVVTGVYEGRLDANGNMNGSWKKPDGAARRPFSFTATR